MGIWISIGLLLYYLTFQVFSDFVRKGMVSNNPNKIIAKLREKYNLNIRTFQRNNNLHGFAWFKTVYINENLYKDKKALLFTFHHEHYHVMRHHKAKILAMRFLLSLIPLLLYVCHWSVIVILIGSAAMLIQHITNTFENKANDYAKKTVAHEDV